jgi:4-hydroxy-tetrahydrodipicolinate reductase
MSELKIAVMGAGGRMGRELVRAVVATSGCTVLGGTERPDSRVLGQDVGVVAGVGPLGVPVTSDALELIARADAVLDFTRPDATVEHAGMVANARIVHVIGTTGLEEKHEKAIRAAARHAAIVKSGNMSLGVNLLVALAEKVAKALDADYDAEILEMHHRHKVDAPSGTALMLGNAVAAGRGVALKDTAVRARDGVTGERKRGDIGFAVLRGGSVVGDHTVIFAGEGERVELTHRAGDRSIFARGAVKAALWGRGKPPGLYTMADVLGV